MTYKFSDEVLAAVAQCLQLGMLTSTDIVDHLRLLEVEPSLRAVDAPPAELVLSRSGRERHQKNIDDLTKRSLEIAVAKDLD